MPDKKKQPLDDVRYQHHAATSENRFPKAKPQTEPLQLSGVWRMESTEQADALLGGTAPGFAYRREGHPNATSLADALRSLHNAQEAIVTAQGMSAISIACMALLKPGDRVLLAQPVYGRTSFFIKQDLARWGIQFEDVVATDLTALKNAFRTPARMVIVESITNPRLSVPDLESIATMAHESGGPATSESGTVVLVDNTFATPVLCQPMNLGADLVMESLSKFVCGHADAMLGFLCGHKAVWQRIRQTMASLPVRMAHAAASAKAAAEAIQGHAAIDLLDYPGLTSHPEHAMARKQFGESFGNMMTLRLHGGLRSAQRFIAAVAPNIPFCPTLGEAQTTLSHPCSTSHRSYSDEALAALGITGGTLRFSIGLEPTDWLIEKLTGGLDGVTKT
jgi:cystathionine beta-lyase/cystathionine gamma-synthase